MQTITASDGLPDRSFGEAIAEVAAAWSEDRAQESSQQTVGLAVPTIARCDHAGVSSINEEATLAGSEAVLRWADRLRYDA